MQPKSGMESMLRSLGLGEVLDAANELAKSGAVQKVIAFSEQAELINAKLDAICSRLGIEAGSCSANGGLVQDGTIEPVQSARDVRLLDGPRTPSATGSDNVASPNSVSGAG